MTEDYFDSYTFRKFNHKNDVYVQVNTFLLFPSLFILGEEKNLTFYMFENVMEVDPLVSINYTKLLAYIYSHHDRQKKNEPLILRKKSLYPYGVIQSPIHLF